MIASGGMVGSVDSSSRLLVQRSLTRQRDPDGADLQTAEEAGPEPEAAEADRHIVVDAEARLDDRQEGELVAVEPHAVLGRPSAPRPRAEEERRVETRLA